MTEPQPRARRRPDRPGRGGRARGLAGCAGSVPARVRTDPQHLGAARARGRHGHGGGVGRGPAAPGRCDGCRGGAHGAAPDRLRAHPRGTRRARRARVLPLRRPAGGPGGAVGDGAVRAVPAGRPVRRPGRGRRQGPARDAPLRARGAAGGRPGARGEPHVRVRGRGGVRLRQPVRVDRGEPGPPGLGRGGDQRHRLLRGQHPGHHGGPARDHVRADRRRAVAGGPALGLVRRDRGQPGQRARPDHRRAQGPRRPGPDPGLLRRCRLP